MPRRVLQMELRDIVHRLRLGQSVKAIHRETGRHKTVIRAVRDLAAREGWLNPLEELPSEGQIGRRYQELALSTDQRAHPLQAVEEPIREWLEAGTSFQVIHRLLLERGFAVSESTVRRWIHRRYPRLPTPIIIRSTIPGEAMEVDFGYLGVFREQAGGRLRKAWFFSGRLRHSRRVYRQVVLEQNQAAFFRCHINAFEFFGGVPRKVVPDNLKAAIVRASLENPLVNRAYRNLAEHYGFLISPCPPGRPELKGGVESDVKYVKRNFLPVFLEHQKQRGQTPGLLEELAVELQRWNAEICDTHIVQKVGRSPLEIFEQEELASLKALPPSRWDPVIYKEVSHLTLNEPELS